MWGTADRSCSSSSNNSSDGSGGDNDGNKCDDNYKERFLSIVHRLICHIK
ncbi:hypothetical protein LOAG_16824 [Loa loa]|uniref:Uncharacterized protein n=1 Tax=Loa loa TaxID=7209 RepID=A0A1S0UKR5_LOALO|nr:hypothetical protein LOAG_16824 [Loa loa]EJD76155.1 hypothetical protein LOAG_16824 [Loa loa]